MAIVRVNKSEEYDVFIGRPSKFGNPFVLGQGGTRSEVIAKFEEYLRTHSDLDQLLNELDGKRIACFCSTEQKCHGEVYIKLFKERAYNTKMKDVLDF
jgi:hypothetical protein